MFSQFSLDNGVTLNPDAALEQVAVYGCLYLGRQDLLRRVLLAVGNAQVLHLFLNPTAYPSCAMLLRQEDRLYVYCGATRLSATATITTMFGAVADSGIGQFTYTNSFFAYCLRQIEPAIIAALPADWLNCKIHFVGHSQGAAVAFVMGLLWRRNRGMSNAYDWMGIGSPKEVGGRELLVQDLPATCYALANRYDPIPQLPRNIWYMAIEGAELGRLLFGSPGHWRHYGRTLVISDDGSGVSYDARRIPYVGEEHLLEFSNKHNIRVYANNVNRWWLLQR